MAAILRSRPNRSSSAQAHLCRPRALLRNFSCVTTEIRPRYCGISVALLRNFSRIIIPSGMPRSPSPRRSIRAAWRGMKIFSYFCVPIGGGRGGPSSPPGMETSDKEKTKKQSRTAKPGSMLPTCSPACPLPCFKEVSDAFTRYFITNSTRRLAARPSSVSLVATGSFGPRPS